MPKQPFYKIGSAFHTNHDLTDDTSTGKYTYDRPKIIYTDPDTGNVNKKTKGGAYNAQGVWVKDGGKATGKIGDLAHGSKARYDEYESRGWKHDETTMGYIDTGVKNTPQQLNKMKKISTDSGVVNSSGGSSNFTDFSKYTNFKPSNNFGVDVSKSGTIDFMRKGIKTPSTTSPKDTSKKSSVAQGLIRRAAGDGTYSDATSDIMDYKVGRGERGVDIKSGRRERKALKIQTLNRGMTRREARLQKTLGKAVAAANVYGGKVVQYDKAKEAGGKIVRESLNKDVNPDSKTFGSTVRKTPDDNIRGKARKKRFRMVNRANRIINRMKPFEGKQFYKG